LGFRPVSHCGIGFASLEGREIPQHPGPPPHGRRYVVESSAASPFGAMPRLRNMLRNRNLIMSRVRRTFLGADEQVPQSRATQDAVPVQATSEQFGGEAQAW